MREWASGCVGVWVYGRISVGCSKPGCRPSSICGCPGMGFRGVSKGHSYSVHNAKRRIIETLCQIIVSKRRDLLSWRFFLFPPASVGAGE